MEDLNEWFNSQASTPMGSLLVFLLVFLLRYSLARIAQRQRSRADRERKGGTPNAA